MPLSSTSEFEPRSDALAVLTGNGVSIGFNKSLRLDQITSDVLDKFETKAEGTPGVREALIEISNLANGVGGESENDFEALVGAFDGDFLKTEKLKVLAEEFAPNREETIKGLHALEELASEVNRVAVSYILETIFEKSRATVDEDNPYVRFVDSIVRNFRTPIHFGNLNYDSLLLSALLSLPRATVSDGADGRQGVHVSAGEHRFTAHKLRMEASDFPPLSNSGVRLLHLHGSLTYWSDDTEDLFIKIKTEDLAKIDQWDSIRTRRNKARPVVVLTNQQGKAGKVQDFPFNLAYSMFDDGLRQSSRWLIAGYSFRDEAANQLLRNAYESALIKPTVLVVTLGDKPSECEISKALSVPPATTSRVSVFREGVENLVESPQWEDFCAKTDTPH